MFTLKQSLDGYRYYQKLIAELDREIQRLMQTLPSAVKPGQEIPRRTKHSAFQRQGNDPGFDLRGQLYRIAGVDLTDIAGVSAVTAQVILTEVGPDLRRFRNASAFASWLGLCPENRVSGGKVLSCKTRKLKSRAALALRQGANSLCRAKGYFGEFFRRMRSKLGTAQAITLPDALASLGSLCLMQYEVDEKTTVTKLPQPSANQVKILTALGVTLPARQ
jgi:transposase